VTTAATDPQAPTLRPDAVGFLDTFVIGLAATSPAYSLAAVLGPIVALVGVHAPGVLLASFLPMLLIAGAFAALNRVDPDCGTTFSWVTRAMGPWTGWIGGWAIAMTGVLVLGSLAEVGVRFTLLAAGLDGWADSTPVVMGLSVLLVVVMAGVCVRGTELSARLQNGLIVAQTVALAVFTVVALVRGLRGTSPLGGLTPQWSWLDPFGSGGAALSGGLLLGVFAYWGWESAVNLTVATSAVASTQTTIIPASRTGLSMARRAALPHRFASISPIHRTPDVSTWWVAGIGVIWYVGVGLLSENALYDSITGLSLLIALYYALTGLACAVYFRRHLFASLRNLLLLGVGPLVGAAMLTWLLVLSVRDLADAENSYTGQAWLGVGPPLVIGVGVMAAGVVLMLWWRRQDARFWRERPSTFAG
jgi:amino acid transporter